MAPTTSPSLRLGGTTKHEKVLSAWNTDKSLRDKSPITKAIALGQTHDKLELKLVGQRSVEAEAYRDQGLTKMAGDKDGKQHAAAVLDATFRDTQALVRAREAVRTNTNSIVGPIASFYEGPRIDPRDGARGPVTAKPYTLLKPVKLSPSTTLSALALSKDAELDDLDDQIAKTEAAIVPEAEAVAKLKKEFDELAAKGALHVRRVGPFKGTLAWPEVNINAAPRQEGWTPRAVDTAALFVRHFRGAIEAEAIEALRAFYSGADIVAMSPQQRHDTLRKLRSTRRAVERVRIEATWQALAAGEDIWHRADSDPWALLGIEKNV